MYNLWAEILCDVTYRYKKLGTWSHLHMCLVDYDLYL